MAIRRSGSLAAAAREIGYSYRHVWNLLGEWNLRLDQPLVELERGRGARLTPLAVKLIELEQRARTRLAPHFAELSREFEHELYGKKGAPIPGLSLHASHDLALERLPELAEGILALELQFHGSVESLAALARGDCDLAGFHVAEQWQTPEILQRLRPEVHKLIGVAVRDQGLIIARGNPKGIQSLRDLARPGVRFVGRQRGSGTRLVFDQLIARAGIEGHRISGYENEEFTHVAVAAAVANNVADASFGIRAAAAQFGLGFIPLVGERYLLACEAARLESAELKKLLALLRGKPFKAVLAALPGYDGAITGRVMEVEEGLAGPRPARVAVRR
ncbi:MAG TPA: substrate-binding domain-containing protein [Burkholderiales bacterium]|nr:substrate-binding domain-containing protein [Burkholderiales bacterium]